MQYGYVGTGNGYNRIGTFRDTSLALVRGALYNQNGVNIAAANPGPFGAAPVFQDNRIGTDGLNSMRQQGPVLFDQAATGFLANCVQHLDQLGNGVGNSEQVGDTGGRDCQLACVAAYVGIERLKSCSIARATINGQL